MPLNCTLKYQILVVILETDDEVALVKIYTQAFKNYLSTGSDLCNIVMYANTFAYLCWNLSLLWGILRKHRWDKHSAPAVSWEISIYAMDIYNRCGPQKNKHWNFIQVAKKIPAYYNLPNRDGDISSDLYCCIIWNMCCNVYHNVYISQNEMHCSWTTTTKV